MGLSLIDLDQATALVDSNIILIRQDGEDRWAYASQVSDYILTDQTSVDIDAPDINLNGNINITSTNATPLRVNTVPVSLVDHNHDDRYYQRSTIDTALAEKSSIGHDHSDLYFTQAEVTALVTGGSAAEYYTKAEINSTFPTITWVQTNYYGRDYIDTIFFPLSGGTITGPTIVDDDLSVTGDVTITGDLTINGTTTTVNTQTLEVADNLILVNSSLSPSTTPPAGLESGMEVNRGLETNYQFLFQESSDTFKIGETGSLQAVATREDTPITDAIPIWNASENRFDTGDITYPSENNLQVMGKRVVTATQGTVFPTSPGFADECYRTDLNAWYKYTGSVWIEL